jgi:hypothetical protein
MCALPCGQFESYEMILFFRERLDRDKRADDQVLQDVEGLEDLEQGRCGRSLGERNKRARREKPPTTKADRGAAATKFRIFGF